MIQIITIICCALLTACASQPRVWSGRPVETFQSDKKVCQKSSDFEQCMLAKGWKVDKP
jgi:hypothetical protein